MNKMCELVLTYICLGSRYYMIIFRINYAYMVGGKKVFGENLDAVITDREMITGIIDKSETLRAIK